MDRQSEQQSSQQSSSASYGSNPFHEGRYADIENLENIQRPGAVTPYPPFTRQPPSSWLSTPWSHTDTSNLVPDSVFEAPSVAATTPTLLSSRERELTLEESLFVSDDEVAVESSVAQPRRSDANDNLTGNQLAATGTYSNPSGKRSRDEFEADADAVPPIQQLQAAQTSSGHSSRQGVVRTIHWYDENHTQATVAEFSQLSQKITSYQQNPSTSQLEEIRQGLQGLQFFQGTTHEILNQSGLSARLVQVKNDQSTFPWDIKETAAELHNRFSQGIFSPNLYQGLALRILPKGNVSWSEDKPGTWRNNSSAHVGGQGLVNGQWWPMTMLAKQDGAHGNSYIGIHGRNGQGAFSIVLAGGKTYKDDLDEGDRIIYCGQASKDTGRVNGTTHLRLSFERQQVIRVLRSSALPRTNQYRPSVGTRYDGLYRITQAIQMQGEDIGYKFELHREPGQGPIRSGAHPTARPTEREIREEKAARVQQENAKSPDDADDEDDDEDEE